MFQRFKNISSKATVVFVELRNVVSQRHLRVRLDTVFAEIN
jgi:hypothetical protein